MNRKKRIFENKFFIALLITVVISLISKFILQPMVFLEPKSRYAFLFINITFTIIIYIVSILVLSFIEKVKNKEVFYINWLKHSTIYLFGMLVFLFVLWPGHFVWDEFLLIDAAKTFDINVWHSYLTIMFMSYSLMLIPFVVGIIIIQLVLISIIFGFLQSNIIQTFKNKYANIITYFVFFLPAVIINNFYPLRLTLYSYVLLLLFTILIFDNINKTKITFSKFILLYFLSAIAILWRSEGIIYIFLIPIFIFISYWKQINIKKIFLLFVIFIITNFSYNGILNSIPRIKNYNEKYGLTIYVNPLSIMVQQDLKGKNIKQDLENIDKVFNLDLLKKYPSYLEIPSYWKNDFVRTEYLKNIKDFKKSYINIILNNPKSFIEARYKTFIASSGLDSKYLAASSGLAYYIYEIEHKSAVKVKSIEDFLDSNKLTRPINFDLKAKLESILIGHNISDNSSFEVVKIIFWNFIPIIIALFILMIERIIKKDYLISIICLSFLIRVALIFLTSPASYFMYFLPEYIIGLVILIIFFLKIFNEKKIDKSNVLNNCNLPSQKKKNIENF
jgi:hypothetical protein